MWALLRTPGRRVSLPRPTSRSGARPGRRLRNCALNRRAGSAVGSAAVSAVEPSILSSTLPGAPAIVDIRRSSPEALPSPTTTFDKSRWLQLVVPSSIQADPAAGIARCPGSATGRACRGCVWDYGRRQGSAVRLLACPPDLDPAADRRSGLCGRTRRSPGGAVLAGRFRRRRARHLTVRAATPAFAGWFEPYTRSACVPPGTTLQR